MQQKITVVEGTYYLYNIFYGKIVFNRYLVLSIFIITSSVRNFYDLIMMIMILIIFRGHGTLFQNFPVIQICQIALSYCENLLKNRKKAVRQFRGSTLLNRLYIVCELAAMRICLFTSFILGRITFFCVFVNFQNIFSYIFNVSNMQYFFL